VSCALSYLVSDVSQDAASVLDAGNAVGLERLKHAAQDHRSFRRHEFNRRARGGCTREELRRRVAALQFGSDVIAASRAASQSFRGGGRHDVASISYCFAVRLCIVNL